MPTASSTFIYIGNFADLDPNEANFFNENPSAIYQTFDNTEMSVVTVIQDDVFGDGQVEENDNGQTPDTFTYDIGGGSVTSGLDNAARYSVTYLDENANSQSTTVSGYQTENGDVFLKFPNGLKVMSVTVTGIVADNFMSITHGTSSSTVVVCFAPGTMIDCPSGARAIESLKVGDLVETLDHGPKPIRWIYSGDHPLEDMGIEEKPVLIKTGALGVGLPARDLIVSSQHRIFVGARGQLEDCFESEALAPAKALTSLRGIRYMSEKAKVTWIHIALDNHEVLYANGCLAESLLLGPMALQGLTPTKRRILSDMYGRDKKSADALNGSAVYPCLKVAQVRRKIANAAPSKTSRSD